MTYPVPPFKIKMVEPISLISKEDRCKALELANFNLFNLKAHQIYLDFLTDSGTGSMSQNQWAAMMKADETYANAQSFENFMVSVQNFTGLPQILPTHQGRAAENILFGHILQDRLNSWVVSNQSFDTTVGHILHNKAIPVDIPDPISKEIKSEFAFKGNMDVDKLTQILKTDSDKVSIITLVLTNNAGGGQPVSIQNIEEVANIAKRYKIPFCLDIARIVENAFFIQKREPSYAPLSLAEIVQQICSFADVVWMSCKKDGYVNIGGFIALKNDNLADRLRERLILFEGFPTYGGLAGRDLEAIAVGLNEVVRNDVVAHRVAQVKYIVEELDKLGIPVILPAGGHGVFIDAKSFLPHIPPNQFPGQALACEIYIEGGIRSVEIGSLMFGRYENGEFLPASQEFVRMAIPRRVYSKAHFDYTIEILKNLFARKEEIRGMRIVEEPELLRHFTCKLSPITKTSVIQ